MLSASYSVHWGILCFTRLIRMPWEPSESLVPPVFANHDRPFFYPRILNLRASASRVLLVFRDSPLPVSNIFPEWERLILLSRDKAPCCEGNWNCQGNWCLPSARFINFCAATCMEGTMEFSMDSKANLSNIYPRSKSLSNSIQHRIQTS